MIAKIVPMRCIGRSDYSGLVKYLTDKQGKKERVGSVSITNCQSDNWQVAVTEVLNTQVQNKRAVSDKTYHLIVSFRADEHPDDATLKEIEERICVELGYAEHQRISIVHHDTDNLHFHIALNKIHPTRHTIHDPYHVYRTLGYFCERVEREYGLEGDNHHPQKTASENRAADMEHQAGVQSLLGWIMRECGEQMQKAQSWAELHTLMNNNGLMLQEKGNGLVITDGTGLGVKASSVARALSKASLEQGLGRFEAGTEIYDFCYDMHLRHGIHRKALTHSPPLGKIGNNPPPRSRNLMHNLSQLETMTNSRRYRVQPLRSRVDTTELYLRYRKELQIADAARASERARVAERKKRLLETVKKMAQAKRAVIKLVKGPRVGKKLLYGTINKTLKDEIRRINKKCRDEHLAIDGRYARHSWADWLKAKAIEGDPKALCALRAREAACGLRGDTIAGKAGPKTVLTPATRDGITKKGTIIYRIGSTAVRDDGDKLKVSRYFSLNGLQAALRLAMEHYGDCITVNGSEAFKEQVVRAATAARLPITFADGALEHRRRELLQSGIIGERRNGYDEGRNERTGTRTTSRRSGGNRGRNSRGTGRPRFADAGIDQPGTTQHTAASGNGNKPDIGAIGQKPPPQSQNRLRELSELGLVHFPDGGKVLLPRDVSHHLEQQGAQPDHGVRRDTSGPGIVTGGQAAADKYITEREAIRRNVPDVPKHLRFDAAAGSGATIFAGIRRVDGQMLALLKHGEEIMVLPVEASIALRLKHLAIGKPIAVTARGIVAKAKGRKI